MCSARLLAAPDRILTASLHEDRRHKSKGDHELNTSRDIPHTAEQKEDDSHQSESSNYKPPPERDGPRLRHASTLRQQPS